MFDEVSKAQRYKYMIQTVGLLSTYNDHTYNTLQVLYVGKRILNVTLRITAKIVDCR